ncbi:MAG: oligosaccharide flippase family protein [Proteobacteria bacterium]|nr:oligosaccharide flippase family protein [Pseudomonadota bacterium]
MEKAKREKSFFHHAMIYWLGRMAARSLQILLLPIYTVYLAPADYGKLSIFAIIMDVAVLIMGLQLPVTVYKFWASEKNKVSERLVLSSAMLLTLVVPSVLFLPLYLQASFFTGLLDMHGDANLLRLVLAEGQLSLIVTIVMTEMRVRDQSRRFALWEVCQRLGVGLLSILLVAGLGWGIWGMFVAQTSIFFVITLFLLPPFVKRIGLSVDWGLIKKMLAYSLPLVPAAVTMVALHSADRFFLQHMVGLEETGLYAIGYKFGMLVSILVSGPFMLIWEPKRFVIAKQENAAQRYGQMFTFLLVAASSVALAIGGMAKEIVHILTAREYWSAYSLVALVAWGYVLFALCSVVNVGLFVHHKTGIFSVLVGLTFLCNVWGNIMLIPAYGAHGAAVSTLISFGLFFLLNVVVARRSIAIAFEWRRILQLMVVGGAAATIMFFLDTGYLISDVAGKVLVMVCFLGVLTALGFFPQFRLAQRATALIPSWKGRSGPN